MLGTVARLPCPAPADTVDCIPADGYSHSIGTVRADPDGTLWLGSGDAAELGQGRSAGAAHVRRAQPRPARSSTSTATGAGLPGHPFCPGETDLTKVCTKLYAKGFRNPFRFQLRPGRPGRRRRRLGRPRGARPHAAGRSYGWPCYEGRTGRPSYQDLASCTGRVRRRARRAQSRRRTAYLGIPGATRDRGRPAVRPRRSTRPTGGTRGSSATTRRA